MFLVRAFFTALLLIVVWCGLNVATYMLNQPSNVEFILGIFLAVSTAYVALDVLERIWRRRPYVEEDDSDDDDDLDGDAA